jgi:hypothetical protein
MTGTSSSTRRWCLGSKRGRKDRSSASRGSPESGLILFESYRRVLLRRFPHMAVYLVGANRIDVLAVVAVRRDPAWIETTVSERADD